MHFFCKLRIPITVASSPFCHKAWTLYLVIFLVILVLFTVVDWLQLRVHVHRIRGKKVWIFSLDTWSCPIWSLHMFYLLRPEKPKSTTHNLLLDLNSWQLLTFSSNINFQWSIFNRSDMPAGDAYPSGHISPFLLGMTAVALFVETNTFPKLVVIPGLCSLNIPRYFLDFTSRFFDIWTIIVSYNKDMYIFVTFY